LPFKIVHDLSCHPIYWLCRRSWNAFAWGRLVATVYSRYKLTRITYNSISGDLWPMKSMSPLCFNKHPHTSMSAVYFTYQNTHRLSLLANFSDW